MKRIIMAVLLISSVFILSGCIKNNKAITYTRFIESFKDKDGFLVDNQTLKYEDKFERCLEASGNNVQFLYYEFKTEDQAKKYISDNYKNRKKFRYNDNKKYITVKCSDKMYFYAIQIDKIVIIGDSPIKSNKKIIKSVFKEFGY